jgi:dinuclear metal center YbgI/SA1388 family protein
MESFERAHSAGADLLFVHHGLFWGEASPIRGTLYRRIRFLLEKDMALYAVHLPLDAHPRLGNNAGIARELQLEEIEPFGEYKGVKIGFKGGFSESRKLEHVEHILCGDHGGCLGKLPFGPTDIRTVGIVSGGAPEVVGEAIATGLDLYITGDASHTIYHQSLEGGINVIFGGHYRTEVWGIRELAIHLEENFDIETQLLDIPTGL